VSYDTRPGNVTSTSAVNVCNSFRPETSWLSNST